MMAAEYKSYLAANILSEDRVITYRILSRALKVHVNVAKEMLYEFHRMQNGKKPGSIHAMYLVAGTMRKSSPMIFNSSAARDGKDGLMQSSPYRSSPNLGISDALNDSPLLSVTLVREADLQGLRSQYEAITSIHIHSIALQPLTDLQALFGREIKNMHTGIYIEEGCGIYGTVVNKCMRRCKGIRSPLVATIDAQTLGKTSGSQKRHVDENSISATSSLGRVSSKVQSRARPSSSSGGSIGRSSQEKIKASNPQVGQESSSIFKSFAKAKPKLSREALDLAPMASELEPAMPSGADDETMKYASEEEEEESYAPPAQTSPESIVGAHKKSRIERAVALKKMMDDDDLAQEFKPAITRMEPHVLVEQAHASRSPEEAAQSISGRRRGKKRVLKKKTVKDEDGYLITREEPVWESFSEDEVVATKSKASSFTATSEVLKKGSSRPGQGSIMSFFGKK